MRTAADDLHEGIASRCKASTFERLVRVPAEDVRRGDLLCGRSSRSEPGWSSRAVVLVADVWRDDAGRRHLSCDLMWLDTRQVVSRCSLSIDDEFDVDRPKVDPVIEAMRASFCDYCQKRGL